MPISNALRAEWQTSAVHTLLLRELTRAGPRAGPRGSRRRGHEGPRLRRRVLAAGQRRGRALPALPRLRPPRCSLRTCSVDKGAF